MAYRYVHDFEIDQHAQVVKAYLRDGKSHRAIQREILGLPAPANGGGFIAMNILHHYGIHDDKKAILQRSTPDVEIKSASPQYAAALRLLETTNDFEASVQSVVSGKTTSYKEPSGPTEMPKGFFSISENTDIILGQAIPGYIALELRETKFRQPAHEEPAPEFLAYHRDNILKRGAATDA